MTVCLPSWVVIAVIHLGYVPATGAKNCEGFGDCVIFSGYTCKNNKCVCDPEEPGYFRCIPPKFYGERCTSDQECQLGDYNSNCLRSDIRICKCKRGYVWDMERKKCLPTIDDDMYSGKVDPVRNLVIPGLIIITVCAMVYLGFKVFGNCSKTWRRRRHQEIARELEEISAGPHQQAWIASYSVYSPYSNSDRSSSVLSPTSFPLHHAPCMGLLMSSQSLCQSPPPYEEALKHKVILSSYHNSGPAVVPVPVTTYALPPSDVPRQYQTLPPNASSSSSIILNPNRSNPSTLKYSGHRLVVQNENYGEGEWTQIQYSGTTGTHIPQGRPVQREIQPPIETPETPGHHSRVTEVWEPRTRNPQILMSQSRGGVYRPGQPQKIYHLCDFHRGCQNNERNF